MFYRYLFIVSIVLSSYYFCFGQLSSGGLPLSTTHNLTFQSKTVDLGAFDLSDLVNADLESEKDGNPFRFAISIKREIDLSGEGIWHSIDNHFKVCLLSIKSEGALGLIIYYSHFEIPEGGKLYIYSKDKRQVIGAFTSETNPKQRFFATELIKSDEVFLEYYSNSEIIKMPEIVISEVGIAYRTVETNIDGFGGSGACEVNINCEEGLNYQNEKRSVSRIIVKQGSSSYWCTGSLLNNVRQDFTPYLLTADHCGFTSSQQELDQWIFYFKYEGPECQNPISDTAFNKYTIVGATKIASAGKQGTDIRSDFKLLLLNEIIPASHNPYFLGWTTSDTGSSYGVTIHHPQGDIMKVSTYSSPLIATAWSNTPDTHWKVFWTETANGHGVTEGGSSGCPILDSEGRLLGQLTGGEATCNTPASPDYYGQFRYSWDQISVADSTKLKPWLDPDNTGITSLNGGWLGISKKFLNTPRLEVYPNPANEQIVLKNADLKNQMIVFTIYQTSGEKVVSLNGVFNSEGELRIGIENLKSGLYFISICAKNVVLTTKLLINK